MIDECPVCDKYNVARVRVYRPTWPVESRLLCEEHANDAFRAGVGIPKAPTNLSIRSVPVAKAPCLSPACTLKGWSRGLCQSCYRVADERRLALMAGPDRVGTETAWKTVISEITRQPAPENSERALRVSLAATKERLAAVESERDAARAMAGDLQAKIGQHQSLASTVVHVFTRLAGYLGAPDDGPWEELPDRLAALLSAHKAELAELRQDLANVRAERDCDRGTAKAIRDAADEKESQLRKALSRADSLGMEIARLEGYAASLEESASRANRAADSMENTIADLKRYPAQIRIEWSENRVNLDVVAGEYRFTLASIFPAESPYVRLYAFPEEGEEQKIHGRDLADVVAITSSLLSLRGIAVPPYPVTE